jgi:phosphoribosylanthranilate isomerase
MIVQIYEVGSPAEATELAAAGVDHVGVLVGPGEFPRELGPGRALEIFDAVPRPAKRVALSLSHDLDAVSSIVRATAPDILHLGTTLELLPTDGVVELKRRFPGLSIMRTIPVVAETSVDAARDHDGIADWLLLDTQEPGAAVIGATGKTHDWSLSRRIVEQVGVRVVLAGGLGPDNVAEAIRRVRPAGVDSKTRTDRADGTGKDLDRVRELVRESRESLSDPT